MANGWKFYGALSHTQRTVAEYSAPSTRPLTVSIDVPVGFTSGAVNGTMPRFRVQWGVEGAMQEAILDFRSQRFTVLAKNVRVLAFTEALFYSGFIAGTHYLLDVPLTSAVTCVIAPGSMNPTTVSHSTYVLDAVGVASFPIPPRWADSVMLYSVHPAGPPIDSWEGDAGLAFFNTLGAPAQYSFVYAEQCWRKYCKLPPMFVNDGGAVNYTGPTASAPYVRASYLLGLGDTGS